MSFYYYVNPEWSSYEAGHTFLWNNIELTMGWDAFASFSDAAAALSQSWTVQGIAFAGDNLENLGTGIGICRDYPFSFLPAAGDTASLTVTADQDNTVLRFGADPAGTSASTSMSVESGFTLTLDASFHAALLSVTSEGSRTFTMLVSGTVESLGDADAYIEDGTAVILNEDAVFHISGGLTAEYGTVSESEDGLIVHPVMLSADGAVLAVDGTLNAYGDIALADTSASAGTIVIGRGDIDLRVSAVLETGAGYFLKIYVPGE